MLSFGEQPHFQSEVTAIWFKFELNPSFTLSASKLPRSVCCSESSESFFLLIKATQCHFWLWQVWIFEINKRWQTNWRPNFCALLKNNWWNWNRSQCVNSVHVLFDWNKTSMSKCDRSLFETVWRNINFMFCRVLVLSSHGDREVFKIEWISRN